ncbi:MAG: Ig-like domain-containing protein [Gemmatimonadaceae bacterium]
MTGFVTLRRFVFSKAAVAATAALLALACGDSTSSDGPSVARIEAIPSKLDLLVGETKAITARALDASGAPVARKLFWSTSAPTVATVTQEGIVTSVTPGESQIAVSGGGKSVIVPVTVAGRPAALLRVTPATTTLRVGQSSSLTGDVLDATGAIVPGRTITWSSSNPAVATVNTNGVVTAVGAGNVTITAASGNVTGTALVSVQLVAVSSVAIAPTSAALLAGESLQLTAEVRDANGNPLPGRNVTWATSAPTVATVSSTGFIIAFSPGSATITATSEGKSATAQLTVSAVPVANVTIIPGSATVAVHQTAQLVARVDDSTGAALNGRSVTWTSNAPNVATVDGDGIVTAVATGQARISATSEGKSGTSTITVTPIPVASINLSPATLALTEGETQQLTARVYDALGNVLAGRVITYLSGAPAVATVDATGLVTAVGPGTALIIATSEGARATTSVSVVAASVAKVAVSPSTGSLLQGATAQLTATITDSRGLPMAGKVATWTSSNPTVASVSSAGLVRAVAPGSATITATSDGVSGTATFAISLVPVASVTLSPATGAVFTGRTLQLTVAIEDANGNALSTVGRTVVWTSSDPAVASVGSTGVVTGTAPGSATITATVQGKSGTSSLTVTNVPVSAVTVAPTSAQLAVGGSMQLTATAKDASGAVITGRPVTWSSSDATIATVSATGLVSALAAGPVQLTASIGGVAGSASLTVTVAPVASVSVTPPTSSLAVGATAQLSAAALDAAGNTLAGRPATWASSSSSVATVDANGLVTAVAVGSATITATVSGVQGTATVSVSAVPVASVAVSPASPSVNVGATVQLSATAKDAAGNTLTGRPETWASDNTAIATVSASGLVTGVAVGAATITATVGGISATASVAVTSVPVASISVTPATATVAEGATTTLTATSKDAQGNALPGRAVTWSSSAPTIATVSPNGVVTAVAVGTATITATGSAPSGGGSAPAGSSDITVTPAPVLSIKISPSAPTITVGGTVALTASLFGVVPNVPLPTIGRTITWSSSNVAIATVSPTGIVTGVAAGNATITVSALSIGQTTAVTASVPLIVASPSVAGASSVVIAPVSGTIHVGTAYSRQLTAQALDAAGAPLPNEPITWSTSDPTRLTVTSSSTGSAILTASGKPANGLRVIASTSSGVLVADTIVISTDLVTISSVTVAPISATVVIGASQTLTSTALDSAGNPIGTSAGDPLGGRASSWKTNDPKVAAVTAAGVVTGMKKGSATIEVRIGAVGPATANITVTTPAGTSIVSSVAVSPNSTSLIQGATSTFSATPLDSGGNPIAGKSITWAVNNGSGALSVTSGPSTTMSAIDSGTVLVSATSDGQTGSATVRISPLPVDTVESMPARAVPSVSLSSRGNKSATVKFRAVSAGGRLPGRRFQVSAQDPNIAVVSIAGTPITDASGRGGFVVTTGTTARKGDSTVITVTVDGKSTRWLVSIT